MGLDGDPNHFIPSIERNLREKPDDEIMEFYTKLEDAHSEAVSLGKEDLAYRIKEYMQRLDSLTSN